MQVLYDGQHPLLEGNGNGIPNEAEDVNATSGLYWASSGRAAQRPNIGGVVAPEQLLGTNKATITAFNISNENKDAITETWVVVRPPGATLPEPGSPVLWLPTVPLDPDPEVEGTYQGEYDGFNNAGDYQLAVYARDTAGRTSEPVLKTVTVSVPCAAARCWLWAAPLTILLARHQQQRADGLAGVEVQGYTNDDIRFYCTEAIVPEVNGLPTEDNVRLAITEWAAADTQDLVVYLTGTGGQDYLQMAPGETLVSLSLQAWLNTLRATMPGRVSVICDFCSSGSFLPSLSGVTDGSRIVISGTGRDSAPSFSSNGEVSFSRFFWRQVLSGANLRGAFLTAANALQFSDGQNAPCLDDTGDGLYTPGVDGRFAAATMLGRGVRIAADPPIILEVSPAQVLGQGKAADATSAEIWANPITSTAPIDKVLAVVFPPGFDPRDCGASNPGELLTMIQEGSGPLWSLRRLVERGTYQGIVYARTRREVSAPVRTSVEQQSEMVARCLEETICPDPRGSASAARRSITTSAGMPMKTGRLTPWKMTLSWRKRAASVRPRSPASNGTPCAVPNSWQAQSSTIPTRKMRRACNGSPTAKGLTSSGSTCRRKSARTPSTTCRCEATWHDHPRPSPSTSWMGFAAGSPDPLRLRSLSAVTTASANPCSRRFPGRWYTILAASRLPRGKPDGVCQFRRNGYGPFTLRAWPRKGEVKASPPRRARRRAVIEGEQKVRPVRG